MNNIVGYVEQVSSNNFFRKMLEKIYCAISIEKYSFDKYIIMVNSQQLTENNLKKIVSKIKRNNINTVVLSNEMSKNKDYFINQGIYVIDGKYLMKNLLKDIILYIYQGNMESISNDDLYVAIDDDTNAEIIVDTANLFKSLNIVTCRIKKLKRLDRRLESRSDVVYSITNNIRKGLKRAKIIINFDYDEGFFAEAKYNKDAIIINLYSKGLSLKNSFRGVLVENINIEYNQNCIEKEIFCKYNKTEILESSICNNSYKSVVELCKKYNCSICNLIGRNNNISIEEIKNILS